MSCLKVEKFEKNIYLPKENLHNENLACENLAKYLFEKIRSANIEKKVSRYK